MVVVNNLTPTSSLWEEKSHGECSCHYYAAGCQGIIGPINCHPSGLRFHGALVLVARNRANLEQTAETVMTSGAKALIVDVDLAQPSAAQMVVDQTLRAFGRIDALLNIAGAVPQIDLFEMTDEQWEAGLALKLHGARRLTVAAWPALKQAKGSVVLMSGNSAIVPKGAYAAVGTDQRRNCRARAKAFSDRGIEDGVQVNSVLPGPVMTGRRHSYLEHWAPLHQMSVEEATARFPKEAAIRRYGKPEEIAELMAFLVSPGARWMTGLVLRMDGGEVKSDLGGLDGSEYGDVCERCVRRGHHPRGNCRGWSGLNAARPRGVTQNGYSVRKGKVP